MKFQTRGVNYTHMVVLDFWQQQAVDDSIVVEAPFASTIVGIGRYNAQINLGSATSATIEVTLDPKEKVTNTPEDAKWIKVGDESNEDSIIEFFAPITFLRVSMSGGDLSDPCKITVALN